MNSNQIKTTRRERAFSLVEVLAANAGQDALDNALLVSSFKGDLAVIDHLLNAVLMDALRIDELGAPGHSVFIIPRAR